MTVVLFYSLTVGGLAMQFKRVGGKIQILAYRGYNTEKKRALTKMLGSMCAYTFTPTVGLLDSMTVEEKEELQAYIQTERQAAEKQSRHDAAKPAALRINRVADAIKSGDFQPSEEWAAKVWSAMDGLAKELRRAGYPKPKKMPQKPPEAAQGGQGGLELDSPTPTH